MADFATKLDAINVAVNAATDTEITYPVPIVTFVIKTRNQNPFQWRATNGAAAYVSYDSGQTMESKVLLQGANYAQTSLGFIRTVGGDDVVEAQIGFEGAVK